MPGSSGLDEKEERSFRNPKPGFSYLWRTGHFYNGQIRRRAEGILRGQRGHKSFFGVSRRSLEVEGKERRRRVKL